MINGGDAAAMMFSSKPGDWNCPACGFLNFSRNIQCRQCGTLKPDGVADPEAAVKGGGKGSFVIQNRPGDWDCPGCGDHVFAKNNVCRRCGTNKPSDVGQAASGGPVVTGGGFVLQNRPGDWNCPSCGDHVFAKNSICRRCGTIKPEGVGQAVTGGPATMGGPGGTFVLQSRPGDWNCPSCGDHVFAKNSTCRRCGTSKPNNAPQAALPAQFQPLMGQVMTAQGPMLAQPLVFLNPDGTDVGQQALMGQQAVLQQAPGGQQMFMMPQPQDQLAFAGAPPMLPVLYPQPVLDPSVLGHQQLMIQQPAMHMQMQMQMMPDMLQGQQLLMGPQADGAAAAAAGAGVVLPQMGGAAGAPAGGGVMLPQIDGGVAAMVGGGVMLPQTQVQMDPAMGMFLGPGSGAGLPPPTTAAADGLFAVRPDAATGATETPAAAAGRDRSRSRDRAGAN